MIRLLGLDELPREIERGAKMGFLEVVDFKKGDYNMYSAIIGGEDAEDVIRGAYQDLITNCPRIRDWDMVSITLTIGGELVVLA
jgi:hypothetical protein